MSVHPAYRQARWPFAFFACLVVVGEPPPEGPPATSLKSLVRAQFLLCTKEIWHRAQRDYASKGHDVVTDRRYMPLWQIKFDCYVSLSLWKERPGNSSSREIEKGEEEVHLYCLPSASSWLPPSLLKPLKRACLYLAPPQAWKITKIMRSCI